MNIHLITVQESPWWALPYADLLSASILSVLVFGFFGFYCGGGSKLSRRIFLIFGVLWIVSSFGFAMSTLSVWPVVFSAALLLFWIWFWSWLVDELNEPYINPGLQWYEGLPKGLPSLRCHILLDGKPLSLAVFRITENGAFVFFDRESKKEFSNDEWKKTYKKFIQLRSCELNLVSISKSLKTDAVIKKVLPDERGMGLKFKKKKKDFAKTINHFLDELRNYGYV